MVMHGQDSCFSISRITILQITFKILQYHLDFKSKRVLKRNQQSERNAVKKHQNQIETQNTVSEQANQAGKQDSETFEPWKNRLQHPTVSNKFHFNGW